jgi:hypothetical protein
MQGKGVPVGLAVSISAGGQWTGAGGEESGSDSSRVRGMLGLAPARPAPYGSATPTAAPPRLTAAAAAAAPAASAAASPWPPWPPPRPPPETLPPRCMHASGGPRPCRAAAAHPAAARPCACAARSWRSSRRGTKGWPRSRCPSGSAAARPTRSPRPRCPRRRSSGPAAAPRGRGTSAWPRVR